MQELKAHSKHWVLDVDREVDDDKGDSSSDFETGNGPFMSI